MQNRVDPYGNIIDTRARGAWMGNRGVIHNADKKIVRPFKLKAWLICKLEFKGRKRVVMTPNNYTELFFFDEATAFAAGHRPCFECRREDYNRFKSLWIQGNPEYQFADSVSIQEIDKILHQERRNVDGSKGTYEEEAGRLPDGSFISYEDKAHLVFGGKMYLWTPFGYEEGRALVEGKVEVLTPRSVVNVFLRGYGPQIKM